MLGFPRRHPPHVRPLPLLLHIVPRPTIVCQHRHIHLRVLHIANRPERVLMATTALLTHPVQLPAGFMQGGRFGVFGRVGRVLE
jgi:hypothetical protein